MRTKHLVATLVLLALALPVVPAHAGGVVSVCDEAHLLAALAGGGTVTFSCSGTIVVTAQITIGAVTTIDGSGQTVTISGNHAVGVFVVDPGVTLNLNDLTVANGSTSYRGGGIENYGTVIVSNSTLSDNSASDHGGGIYSYAGTVTVSNSTFSGNSAFFGGGIGNDYAGALTVSNSTFFGNSATFGGGISNAAGTVTVSNSTFSNNNGWTGGGGIHNDYDGTLTVSNSTFSGNSAENVGGGIFNNEDATMSVSNSTFSANSAGGWGGGIDNYGRLTVSNCTFSGNRASNYGGGGISNPGTVNVSNSTFTGNYAAFGGGIYNDYGMVTLYNTIVANSPIGSNCSGTITDGGSNLSYPDITCPGIIGDPVLGPLQNNGGPTNTMALGPNSAAMDAANDAICTAAPVNNLDQRGVTRPQGLHCDIGAYETVQESTPTPAVTSTSTSTATATPTPTVTSTSTPAVRYRYLPLLLRR